MKVLAAALAVLGAGCATAQLAGHAPVTPPDRGEPRVVVIEPFFETAEWQHTVKTETGMMMSPSPSFFPGSGFSPIGGPFGGTVSVQRVVTDKPLNARVPSLTEEQRQVLAEVQRLRPSWRVTSTGGVAVLTGPVFLMRVIVSDSEIVESNRTFKNLAFGFGLVILPLQLFNLTPVEETERVYGALQRFDVDAQAVAGRLVRYPTQPDYAVNTSTLPATERRFGLDLTYREGLLANEQPREAVLLRGFSLKLASAIVALVEEHP